MRTAWTVGLPARRLPGASAVSLPGIVRAIAFGIAVVVPAALVCVALTPALDGRTDFVVLAVAVAIAAWYGGAVAGISATIGSVLASAILFLEPRGTVAINSPADAATLLVLGIGGLILALVAGGRRMSYQRASQARVIAERAADRSDKLQRLSLALNRPMSPQVLAPTMILQAVDLLGASGGLVASGRLADPEFDVLATYGYTGGTQTGSTTLNAPENPLGDAIRSRDPQVFHGRSERQARYPSLAGHFSAEGDSVVIPMSYEAVAIGAIYLNFTGSCGLGADDREFLLSIGAQCGSALERSRLIERGDVLAEIQRARAAELSTVLDAIGDGIVVADAEGHVTLTNAAVEQLLGREPAHLADLPDRSEHPPGDAATPDRHLVRSPLRPRGWLEIAHFPVTASGTSSAVALIRDVSQTVEAELQRDAFLGVLSHELRTPITTILAGVDLLRAGENRDARSRDILADIDAEAIRLNRIVEDLLVLTRSERGALDVSGEPVLVHRLVRSVVDREQLARPDVSIQVTAADDLAPVEAEPTYVQQIVRNLLSNAIKYGRSPGQPIEIVIGENDNVIETRVLDRGVGLGPDDADRIFSLFYRNPKAIRSAPGAGIGLYVCRLLAEAMGGTIWARSRPGGGSEFGFALPRMRETAGVH